MTSRPWRIWCRGVMRPASRPDTQAPAMMPPMVSVKNQKNCVGASCRCSPRKTGADSTYMNMPLNGMPLASTRARKRGLRASCQ